jgi:hypothetical protein
VSDERLRELKRRFEASHRPEDEAAWLAGRVRANQLPLDRVEFAALLGHAVSRIALGQPEAEGAPPVPQLEAALKASPIVVRRSRLAIGWAALPVWEASREAVWGQEKCGHGAEWPRRAEEGGYHARHRVALEAVDVWLLSRSKADALAAWAAGAAADEVGSGFDAFLRNSIQSRYEPAYRAAWTIEWAAQMVGDGDPQFREFEEMHAWRNALTGARLLEPHVTVAPKVLTALATELVPWLLDYGDPVRARVAARLGR